VTKGLIEMKKILSLVILASAIGLVAGCEDKKSTGGGSTPSKSVSGAAPSTGAVGTTK